MDEVTKQDILNTEESVAIAEDLVDAPQEDFDEETDAVAEEELKMFKNAYYDLVEDTYPEDSEIWSDFKRYLKSPRNMQINTESIVIGAMAIMFIVALFLVR
ncbi:MAG: hypothetical protein II997_04975 [Clostridia bacterium]|nr:hypothetical protein [Clostridia bacterium]